MLVEIVKVVRGNWFPGEGGTANTVLRMDAIQRTLVCGMNTHDSFHCLKCKSFACVADVIVETAVQICPDAGHRAFRVVELLLES